MSVDQRPRHAPARPVRDEPAARSRRRRRVRLLALVCVLAVAAGAVLWAGRGDRPATPALATAPDRPVPAGDLVITAGRSTLGRVATARYVRDGHIDAGALRHAVAAIVPATSTATRDRARITYTYDEDATVASALRRGRRGGTVAASRRVLAARIAAPVRRQQQRNTCEAAALSILLSTVGRDVPEGRLQSALPTSGPLDPQGTGSTRLWGDPERGYVGRPDGGGAAGGFGVYPGPIVATARRFGVRLRDLTGRPPQAVYDALREGRAVMAWVGLSDGPVGTWTSPQGRPVTVNFGEHTVVLHGIDTDGSVLVSNPLEGMSETWSKEKFERMWELLGRRALAT